MTVFVPRLKSGDRTIACPPDKSISVRAVILCSYAHGSSTIKNLSLCDDVMTAVRCMRELGADIRLDGTTAHITGAPFHGCRLNCGNSATTARLLTGLLSGLNGAFELDGDESLRTRPMRRVTESLRRMGARITDSDGHLPIKIIGSALSGADIETEVPSAQVKSALMLAGLNASGPTTVTEKVVTRDHTELMLGMLNGAVCRDGNTVSVAPSILYARDISVVGDVSGAAYPICLTLAQKRGSCVIKSVGINPTRTAYLDLLRKCGARIEFSDRCNGYERSCDITVRGDSRLKPIIIGASDVPRMIDELPALLALACFIDGESVIDGADELRVKESDRLRGMADALKSLGADVTETKSGMIVRGGKPLKHGVAESHGDHRVAMAVAIAGAAAQGVDIIDGECVSVSYPRFFEEVMGV